MLRRLVFSLCFIMSTISFSEPVFPQNPDTQKLTSDEVSVVNKFCVTFKNDLIKDFGIVNNQNVSKETFGLFIKTGNKLRPITADFFESLKEMGADECNF